MVSPIKPGLTPVWAGNEAWPGSGAWQGNDTREQSVDAGDSDSDEPVLYAEPSAPPEQPQERRQAVWGMLRAMSDNAPAKASEDAQTEDTFDIEEHLTPRTASLRRVFGVAVDELVQNACESKRTEGLKALLEHLGRTKVSQGGMVLLDPALRLEAADRDEFLRVARDLIRRVVCDPAENIRGHSVQVVELLLEAFGRHANPVELSQIVQQTVSSILGDSTRPTGPEPQDKELIDMFVENEKIGPKQVIAALWVYVKDSSLIVRGSGQDWMLQLVNTFLLERHLAPAGLIPLESTAAFALKWLATERAPAKRREFATALISSLYKFASKRLEPLIMDVSSKVHRSLMDEFSKIDNEMHAQARTRARTHSATSRASNATDDLSRKPRSRRSSIAGYVATGVRAEAEKTAAVEMDLEVMIKGVNGVRKKEQTDLEMVGSATHLHCGAKGIAAIDGLEKARKVQVLYLHENYISRIQNLHHICSTLTHLYLQDNSISSLEGLEECQGLSKLYLDGNQIAVVEGLYNCPWLEELHMNGQKLPAGTNMQFCPHSMRSLSRSLRVLHASNCQVADVSSLWCLQRLDDIDLSGSCIEHAQPVNQLVSGCPFLTKLDLSRSPVAKQRQSCSEIIAHAEYIEYFNGKEITPKERDFMKRLVQRKAVAGGRRASISEGQRRKSVSAAEDSGGLCGPASRGLSGGTRTTRARRGSL
jgi:hypothetical protein